MSLYYRPSKQSSKGFNILIYESEFRQIQAWTAKKPNIETGGDLFGLWQDDRTAVVQLVLGPGKQCRRTTVSFYQDVDYLERVGNHLTSQEGLCHIGEWHSHHRLGLLKPSGGDESTVWTNMRTYNIQRFFLFISNVQQSYRLGNEKIPLVKIGCFLFDNNNDNGRWLRNPVLKGNFQFLGQLESPFRLDKILSPLIEGGAESINTTDVLNKHSDVEADRASTMSSSKARFSQAISKPVNDSKKEDDTHQAQGRKINCIKNKKTTKNNGKCSVSVDIELDKH